MRVAEVGFIAFLASGVAFSLSAQATQVCYGPVASVHTSMVGATVVSIDDQGRVAVWHKYDRDAYDHPAAIRRIALQIRLTVTKMLARLDSFRFYPLRCQTHLGDTVGSVRRLFRRPG